MATIGGPNTEKDGLVFGYDTNFGVADNTTTTRLYPGEPAVNLFGDISNANARPNRTEYNTSTWTASFQKPPEDVGRVYSHTSGSLNSTWSGNSYGYTLISYSFLANTSYTLSCWVYVSSDCNITAMHQSMEGTTLTNTTNRWYDLNNKGTWQQLSITCNSSSAVSGNAIIAYPSRSGVTDGSHTGFWAIGGAKLEINTHVTPYVLGTRSSTESLIDLTKTTNIDISGASFDSTSQPFWDGTDDRVDVTSHSGIEIVDNVSIEYVYKRLSTDPVLDVIANKYHSTGWELFCRADNTFALAGRNGDGTYYATSGGASMVNNKFYHLVAQKQGTSWKLYVNGELDSSTTANSVGTWSNTGVLQIGGEGNGYFPHMELPILKIYNRVLPVSEIKQNYNAYKNRFDI